MARLVVCVLALLAAGGLAEPAKKVLPQKTADPVFLQKQLELSYLYYHVNEPVFVQEQKAIVNTWTIEKNIEHFTNVTAAKIWLQLVDDGVLPRSVPFTILNHRHRFEAVTLFNMLYSAKDYSTFYKTAVLLREHVNEHMFVYVLTAVIFHRHDTQGIILPQIYEITPHYFFNGEIMTDAQRINTHGKDWVEQYPWTYLWNNDVVIKSNWTSWWRHSDDISIDYFTQDHELNTYYYNEHLTYPFWLGGEVLSLEKDKRGERWWFIHKQILARYYMERLSNGLGEIPELGLDVVQTGYTPGLLYPSGIPFPVRPNHYHLDQPHLVDEIIKITDYERRIRDAIESGFVIDSVGEKINIHTPQGIDVLGRLIEANVDSPNRHYYGDFISLWKNVLGNPVIAAQSVHYKQEVPLVLPSVLEHYQTALRDPAFYMIWKRVMSLFTLWQQQLPLYKKEELALPSVAIQKVEVDKLVTYFEYKYVNMTNSLWLNKHERQSVEDHVSVLVQRPQLNHKPFQVRVNVKSDVAKPVIVRLYLAPKYDSNGYEIPLHLNTENFFLLDQFNYELKQGENTIKRDSTENFFTIEDWPSAFDVFEKVENAVNGKGQLTLDQSHMFNGFPQRFVLPKGRVSGMPFVFMVYISEFKPPKVPFGTGFDPALSIGAGTGAVRWTSDPMGFPLNRPLWKWQIQDLHNFFIQDVTIYHKYTPEVDVPNTQ